MSGALVLLWKSDDNSLGSGHPTHIWGQPLRSDGLAVAVNTSPSLLLTMSAAWQSPSLEGPTVIRAGGHYVLFYSANNYDSASSGIGYATAPSPLGSYTDQSVSGPWLGTRGNAQGAQGPWVFTDSRGATRLAFAAWFGTVGYENGGVRSLWTASLTFNSRGVPSALSFARRTRGATSDTVRMPQSHPAPHDIALIRLARAARRSTARPSPANWGTVSPMTRA